MMVIPATLLLALAQPSAGAVATMPTCSLVTPRGDRIEFFIWSGDDPSQFNFTGVPGSAWPTHTLAGTRGTLGRNATGFVIGGAGGAALALSAQDAGTRRRAATIIGTSQGLSSLPLAYGFCEERPAPETAIPPADREATEADSPAFNPDLWPEEDCAMLLSDGRRIRFKFTLLGPSDLRIQSQALWSGRPVTTRLQWSTSGQGQARFDSPDGPAGDQLFVVNVPRAARVIRFRRLGGGEAAGLSGYGICGYRAIQRRPNAD
jgi:hypothetical protein